jgi:hypothetical protein
MPRLYADRFRTTLATAITTTGQTTFGVASVSGFPTLAAGDFVIISVTSTDGATNERMRVNAAPSGSTFTVVRGAEGSAAATFSTGAIVDIRLTATAAGSINATPIRPVAGGRYFYPGAFSWTVANSTTAPLLGEMNCFPILIPRAGTIDRMGLTVSTRDTVNATAVLRFGLYAYDDATDLPGTLINDAGTVTVFNAGGGSVNSEVTCSIPVTPGWYFAAVARQGTANVASLLTIGAAGATSFGSPSNTALASLGSQRGMIRFGASGALPTTTGAVSGTTDGTLPLYIRLA